MVRVDEMGRIYHDLGVGEDGKQLSTINITLFGRRLLLSGDIYNQACNEVISIANAISYRALTRKIYEPVTLIITKPIDLVKLPFDAESITVTPNAYNNLLRYFSAESVLVTPSVLPSLLKLLIETVSVVPTAYKSTVRHLTDAIHVVPNIFRTWLSTKMLTQPTYVAATAYKQTTHYIPAETVTLTDIIAYGFYIFCNVVVSVACAMGNRSITKRLTESADMISEQMKALVRIVEDEVVHILPTAYKQPKKSLTDTISIVDYIKKIPQKVLTSTISVVDTIKFGTTQYCNQAISVVATLQPFQIIKRCAETITVTATKTVSLIRTLIQNTIITPIFHITLNIFQYLTESVVITNFINGLYKGFPMHTAKETVRQALNSQTLAEIKSATVTKVLHAGTSIESMKKSTITRLKNVSGVYKEGDEQR